MDQITIRTDADVRRIKTPGKGQQDYKSAFPGLKLRAFASGMKCWFVQARKAGGAPVFVKLGEYPDVKLEGAELACASARASLRQGIDPRAEEEAETAKRTAAQLTFGNAAEEWIAAGLKKKNPWRATTAEKVRYVLLGGRLEPWRARMLTAIEADDIEDVLDALSENTKQTFLAPIRGLFKWAVRKGYREKSPVNGISAPMPGGDAAPLIVFEEEGEPDLSELKALLAVLDAVQQALPLSPWPSIYRLGLLTGARYSELVSLPWAELDLDKATWTLPGERSKVKLECKRPLSAAAVAILRGIPRKGELVFPGKISGHSLTKTGREPTVVAAMLAERGHTTGFWYGRLRDTIASWLEFQPDGTERAMAVILNHKPPRDNVRRRNYVKIAGAQQARVLMERWAGVVTQL